MDLKSFLSSEKNPLKELYWSLVIEPGWVQAGVWYINQDKAEVMALSPASAWETDEELINSVDTALSATIQKLPEDIVEPTKVVFGIGGSWVEAGQIKAEYLEKIKVVCSKLDLTPVGFVVLQEAISHLIKSEEGASLNAVVVNVGNEEIELSIFKMGDQQGNALVGRSVSLVDDIVEGLSRFPSEAPFPSRVILYNGKEGELEEERQAVTNANWEDYEKVQFLHTPKVEVVSPDKKVLAVCLAGGLEMAKVNQVSFGKKTAEVKAEEVQNVAPVTPPDLGFYVDRDVTRLPQEAPQPHPPALLEKIKKLKIKLPSFQSQKLVPIGLVGLVVFLVLGLVAWWYLPRAEVVIYLSPEPLEESSTVFLDSKASAVDLVAKVIPGEVVTKAKSGDKSGSVTGSKVVGDKAKGEVKLYRSGGEVTLSAGTVLIGPNNLAFTLDSEAVVASGSASTPGTKTAPLMAEKIGSDYNLPAGSSFKVGNYPTTDIEAKNEAGFSGGSSREIKAVSEDDQQSLEDGLTQELKEALLAEIGDSLAEGQYLVKESLQTTVTKKAFSAKVGDETDSLKLDLSLEATALIVSRQDLFSLAKEILRAKVPAGYVLREDQITPEFELVEEKDGRFELQLKLKVNLLPEINLDEIRAKISGRNPNLAREYLNSLKGFSRAEINIKPHFPGRLNVLPRVAKNISIEVTAPK